MPASSITPELYYTCLTAMFTGLLWVPIILNRLAEMGIWTALKNPQPDTRPHAEWAYRLSAAHRNALENLAVFAPLALIVHVSGIGTATTAAWSLAFFGARVAHAIIYTFGIPLLRTIAFVVGFAAQVALAIYVLGAA
ncbi:MAPEG family protein [Sphingosinicella microcystinivorans]|uniref:MAPEG family protein n=1 Tax=Sphingosinicella microcystinivorans TaxID=335406 RepID=A0ABX9SZ93_SPHMI|nr:MAPEG family protein [Sphingosinicella microcystinivorans]RKS89268.1 MAPEG family protein [Sphingosinicella microcystinivorans]